MDIDPQTFKSGFDAIKAALDTVRSLGDMFKGDNAKQSVVNTAVAVAENEVQLAQGQLAHALGYPLCRAHFPPVIMLKFMIEPNSVVPIYECPECKAQEPSPEYFAKKREKLQTHAGRSRRIASLYR